MTLQKFREEFTFINITVQDFQGLSNYQVKRFFDYSMRELKFKNMESFFKD